MDKSWTPHSVGNLKKSR